MGLGLGLCTIEGLLEIVHQVLDIFKPELIDAASNTAVRMPSRPSMRFRPKLAESCVKSGPINPEQTLAQATMNDSSASNRDFQRATGTY
jgi:hypothetical protein